MPLRFVFFLALLTSQLCAVPADDRAALLATGSAAPNFTAYKPDGSVVKLSSLRGKVVLVDFWATWCGPCRSTMPRIEALHRKLQRQGLVVLGVCVADEKKNFDNWQKQPKVPTSYEMLYDRAGRTGDSAIMAAYQLSIIPTFYLVGKDGKILYGGVGAGEDTEAGLAAALKQAGFFL